MARPQNSDIAITQQVNSRLATRGIRSPCHVGVQTQNGNVTLSGNVQFAHQKPAAVQAASAISGVHRVIDQMTVKPTNKDSTSRYPGSSPDRTS